jgi:NPCBM/NEW2 domain
MAFLRILPLALLIVPLASAGELVTLDNKKATGDITGFTAEGVKFKSGGMEDVYEFTKLDSITLLPNIGEITPGKNIDVELIDGTLFHCTDFKIRNKTAVLTLLSSTAGPGLTIEFPAKNILYMIRDLSDGKLNQAFRNYLSKRSKLDVWIVKGMETLDAIEGTFGDGDEKGEIITFQIKDQPKSPIQFAALYGAIFSPPTDVKVAQTVCRVIDANKNVLNAKSVALAPDKRVLVETTTGVTVDYPSMAHIAKFDFAAGAMRYLSAMNPIKVDLSSPDGFQPEVYRRDRSLDNKDIRIEGKAYPRGLALHSKTVLTYDLAGQYKIFQALAGVDDCVEGENVVTLTIETDLSAKPLFKEVFEKGKTRPKMLNLAVLNVKQLRITVESNFLVGGQLDLADAKVLK